MVPQTDQSSEEKDGSCNFSASLGLFSSHTSLVDSSDTSQVTEAPCQPSQPWVSFGRAILPGVTSPRRDAVYGLVRVQGMHRVLISLPGITGDSPDPGSTSPPSICQSLATAQSSRPGSPSRYAVLWNTVLWHSALGNLDTHLAVFSNTDRQGQSFLRRHYLICPSGAHSSSLCSSPGTSSVQCAPQEDGSTALFLFTVPNCQHQKPPVFSPYPFQTRD